MLGWPACAPACGMWRCARVGTHGAGRTHACMRACMAHVHTSMVWLPHSHAHTGALALNARTLTCTCAQASFDCERRQLEDVLRSEVKARSRRDKALADAISAAAAGAAAELGALAAKSEAAAAAEGKRCDALEVVVQQLRSGQAELSGSCKALGQVRARRHVRASGKLLQAERAHARVLHAGLPACCLPACLLVA